MANYSIKYPESGQILAEINDVVVERQQTVTVTQNIALKNLIQEKEQSLVQIQSLQDKIMAVDAEIASITDFLTPLLPVEKPAPKAEKIIV